MEKFKKWFGCHYSVTKKGAIKNVDRNSYDTPVEVAKRYRSVLAEFDQECDITAEDVEGMLADAKSGKDDKEERVPPADFVNGWLASHPDWDISPAWKEIRLREYGVTTYKDLDQLRNTIMMNVYTNVLPYRAEEIKATLQYFAMTGYQKAIANLVTSIAYDSSYDDAGERWLHGVYDFFQPTESFEIFSTLMKHWCWQVKRKLLDRPVKYHIWINFYGAAGLGKTTALKKMMAPMDDFVSTTSISKLFDDTKEIRRLTENYVLIFDEMAVNVESETSGGRLSSDQKAILKSIITGEKMDARVYGTQDQSKRKITFSSISSANEHLYDVIYDETTMRRFFDFNCTGTRPDSFDDINKFLDNSIYFWRSIDESIDDGYWVPESRVGREISKIQGMYYPTKTTTKMWADAHNARPGTGNVETAFKAYAQWCRETGNKAKAQQYFVRDLQHILPSYSPGNGPVRLDFDLEGISTSPDAKNGSTGLYSVSYEDGGLL